MLKLRAKHVIWWLLVACVAGCARNTVQPGTENRATMPRPMRVLVYEPVVNEGDVTENENVVVPEGQDHREQIGEVAAAAFAAELVEGIDRLGLAVERARRDTPVPENALLVTAKFVDVDEGNQTKRLVVGFGSGASHINVQVRVYYSHHGRRTKLLEFKTHSDSGKMPGAAATMGTGAVVAGGVTATSVVAGAVVGGVKAHRSAIERMAAKSGEQATNYLSEYFGKQGWISRDRVKKAKQ